jgi:hypothetical protein
VASGPLARARGGAGRQPVDTDDPLAREVGRLEQRVDVAGRRGRRDDDDRVRAARGDLPRNAVGDLGEHDDIRTRRVLHGVDGSDARLEAQHRAGGRDIARHTGTETRERQLGMVGGGDQHRARRRHLPGSDDCHRAAH